MQSSPSTAFADVSTFTFWKVQYSSKYLILESVERYSSLDPTGARYLNLETPDARQAAAVASYGASANTFALLDVANRYVLNGASFTPGVLAGLSQSQIAGDLTTPIEPADPGRRHRGQRDHGHHLRGRRRQARCGVREPRRAGGGPGAEDHTPALRRGWRWMGQLALRSSMSLRSTSFRPPQMPCGSRILMA